ncbi:IucA/IucC family C-terminal-domain containing protein [Paractinoplanes deccanensis]|uniref:(2Fe-2S)-binding protein n=1 Tax=Paractinoplanes deccanensis TaxID=113561 RepID=UPI001EF220E3|nr:(2Fe-2S)-binding protein [Actinoplanes deccanensis]
MDGPLLAAIVAGYGTSTRVPGLAADLLVTDLDGWISAEWLLGDGLDLLLAAGRQRWRAAQPHVSAALIWKAYSFWLGVPAVFGWVAARRVPHLTAAQVLVRFDDRYAPARLGMRAGVPVSVLPGDPLAGAGEPRVSVVSDEGALLATLRRTLLDEHVTPLLDAVRGSERISRRLLLGSLSAGIAHAAQRAALVAGAPPGEVTGQLLRTFGLADLVEWNAERVRRRTCCLAFTIPHQRFCADCSYWKR